MGLASRSLLRSTETGGKQYRWLMGLCWARQNERPDYLKRHYNIILQHVNDWLRWKIPRNTETGHLSHPLYCPNVASSDYYLFWSMQNCLRGSHIRSFEKVNNWIKSWLTYKEENVMVILTNWCRRTKRKLTKSTFRFLNDHLNRRNQIKTRYVVSRP